MVGAKGEQHDATRFRIKQSGKTWDLSQIDFEKLKEDFKKATYKNIEISDLRAFIQHKLDQMLQQNATRADFAQRLQGIIDAYNAGSSSADNYFDELVKFTIDLKAESERHIREGLTEDELELFDLLKQEKMTNAEIRQMGVHYVFDGGTYAALRLGVFEPVLHENSGRLLPQAMQKRLRSETDLLRLATTA